MRRRALSALAVVALCDACEFGETTIPDGDPIIVVHAIMRPDVSQQWIVVEQTFTGVGSDSSGGSIPGNQPQIPISEATVTVANTSLPSDPCGLTQTCRAQWGSIGGRKIVPPCAPVTRWS